MSTETPEPDPRRIPNPDWEHGTASTYNNKECRCDECRAAASRARAAWLEKLKDRPYSDIPHGMDSGYRNWGCRCDDCREANRIMRPRYRKKKGQ